MYFKYMYLSPIKPMYILRDITLLKIVIAYYLLQLIIRGTNKCNIMIMSLSAYFVAININRITNISFSINNIKYFLKYINSYFFYLIRFSTYLMLCTFYNSYSIINHSKMKRCQ